MKLVKKWRNKMLHEKKDCDEMCSSDMNSIFERLQFIH